MILPVKRAGTLRIDKNGRNSSTAFSAFQSLLGYHGMTHRIRLAHQSTQGRYRLERVRHNTVIRMGMAQRLRESLESIRHLHSLVIQRRIRGQMPYTRTGDIVRRSQMQEYTGSRLARLVPVIGVYRRIKETREIGGRALYRQVMLVQREHFLLLHACPVGDIMIHECRMIDKHLTVGRLGQLADGSELQVIIGSTLVTPEDRVEDQTSVTDIHTARTTVTTTVIGDVRTDTVIRRNGSVVKRSALYHIDTAALG